MFERGVVSGKFTFAGKNTNENFSRKLLIKFFCYILKYFSGYV